MLGFIRPEYNYSSLGTHPLHLPNRCVCVADRSPSESGFLDALIKDIETDKKVAFESVTTREAYSNYKNDEFFTGESTLEPPPEDLSKPRVKPTEEEEKK